MSVRGEFQRLLGDCLAFLESSSAQASQWPASLDRANSRVEESLHDAARLVLGFHSGPAALDAPIFTAASEADAYEDLTDHLIQICYAIAGR